MKFKLLHSHFSLALFSIFTQKKKIFHPECLSEDAQEKRKAHTSNVSEKQVKANAMNTHWTTRDNTVMQIQNEKFFCLFILLQLLLSSTQASIPRIQYMERVCKYLAKKKYLFDNRSTLNVCWKKKCFFCCSLTLCYDRKWEESSNRYDWNQQLLHNVIFVFTIFFFGVKNNNFSLKNTIETISIV